MKQEHNKYLNLLLDKFMFNGRITRKTAFESIPYIKTIKNELLTMYPRVNTTKLRKQIVSDKDALGVLRGILLYHNKKMISKRRLCG